MARDTDDTRGGDRLSNDGEPAGHPAGRDAAGATAAGTRDGAATVAGEPRTSASRREVLQAAGVGATALATGSLGAGGVAGQSADRQIPTPWLHVEGNQVLDPLGEPVKLRGLNVADPKRVDVTAPARGKTAVQVVDYLTDPAAGWHPRILRVPVQPIDIGEHEPGASGGPPQPPAFSQSELEEYLETHLDPVVQRCRERGVYCIVDFHRHWHESEGSYDAEDTNYWADPDTLEPNEALHEEVNGFWETVAPRYADQSHVLYEVYNEPTQPGMWTSLDNDADIWLAWKEMAQPWVDTVRSHAPNNLILIGSPSWTQSPEGYYIEPFEGENLAYTYHIYPNHNSSAQQDWDAEPKNSNGEGLGGVHEEVPVFVTEFGWQNDIRDDILAGTTSDFGEPFVEFMEERDGIHWTAWCADPIWRPVMFNRPFAPVDHTDEEDAIGNPYEETIPVYCEDLPCEWSRLGVDEGAYDDFSAGFVQDTLADVSDDRVPTVEHDDQPPEAPDPTVVGTTQTSIELSWASVANPGDAPFGSYNVYLDGELHTTLPEGTTSVELTDLVSGETFSVAVTAEDATGNESVPSALTVATDEFDDDAAPATPGGLEVLDRTHTWLEVGWDAVEDEGPAGLHHYAVSVDGELDHTVRVGTTTTELPALTPDTTYDVTVSAVDYAGNESAESDVLAATTEVDRPRPSDLVVDDFDGDTGDGENELGNWVGGDGFASRTITDDETLRLEYDDAGWYGTAVASDVSEYDELLIRCWGDEGGEHEEIVLSFAHADGSMAAVADGEIGTEPSLLGLDLSDASDDDLADPGQCRFGFDNGGSGAIEIDAIWLRGSGGGPQGPVEVPSPDGISASGTTETTTELSWDAVDEAHHYQLVVDGIDYVAVYDTATTLDGLLAGTTYEVGVRAVDDAGNRSDPASTSVTTEGDGGGGDPTCGGVEVSETAQVDGQTVCDVSGDGLFRDVTADGTVGQDDVVHFFENQHREDWKRPELFDFSESGSVGHGDVVALFEDVSL